MPPRPSRVKPASRIPLPAIPQDFACLYFFYIVETRPVGHTYLGEFEQLVLLAVWRLDAEGYGMRIRQELQERLDRPITIGAVYVTLERLAQKGCVRTRTGEPTAQRGGRAKRFYAITPTGITALEDAQQQLARMWQGLRRQTP